MLNKYSLRSLAVALATVVLLPLSLTACQQPIAELSFDKTWIRFAPPQSRMLAGYGTLTNTGTLALTLRSMSSPHFGSISLHETVELEGRSTMREVEQLVLSPKQALVLKPGSFHLMLMQPIAAPELGEEITITFTFDNDFQVSHRFAVSTGP